MKTRSISYGYYSILISAASGKLLATNNERAFFLAQLQDLLSPRFLLNSLPAYKQTASCIDLLAYSIRGDAVRLIIFTIDKGVAVKCFNHALLRLEQYRNEYKFGVIQPSAEVRIDCKKLTGPHQALHESIRLHSLHEDWEFDRYSSIGFYLHDRRGDWMRIWRLTNLYDNSNEQYRELIRSILHAPGATPRTTAPLHPLAS